MALTLNEKQYEGRDLYQIPRLFPRAVRILALNYTTTPAAPVFPRNRANR